MLPAAPPLRPLQHRSATGRARARRAACLPPTSTHPGGGPWDAGPCRLSQPGAQAAQLLGGPSRLLNPRTGSTPAARPPTPQAASGRAGLQVAPCAAILAQGCPSMPCATAAAAWDKTGYGLLAPARSSHGACLSHVVKASCQAVAAFQGCGASNVSCPPAGPPVLRWCLLRAHGVALCLSCLSLLPLVGWSVVVFTLVA